MKFKEKLTEYEQAKESILYELRADGPLTIKEIKSNIKETHPDHCLVYFDKAFAELLQEGYIIEYDPIPNTIPAYDINYDL